MKNLFAITVTLAFALNGFTQGIYDPKADAMGEIRTAMSIAKKEGKHVYIQIGGNWCPWCIKLHNFLKSDAQIDSILHADYVAVKVNYSKENKNLEVLKMLEYPQRFGFPVLVILDTNGKRIHTQDSGFLESGNGYDRKKILSFLKNWSPTALQPRNYLQ
jgi:thioredoxin-related protein